jgi:hypothetical protein
LGFFVPAKLRRQIDSHKLPHKPRKASNHSVNSQCSTRTSPSFAGAEAVQLGTAFPDCPEAGTSRPYREALRAARGDDTAITRAVSRKTCRIAFSCRTTFRWPFLGTGSARHELPDRNDQIGSVARGFWCTCGNRSLAPR